MELVQVFFLAWINEFLTNVYLKYGKQYYRKEKSNLKKFRAIFLKKKRERKSQTKIQNRKEIKKKREVKKRKEKKKTER